MKHSICIAALATTAIAYPSHMFSNTNIGTSEKRALEAADSVLAVKEKRDPITFNPKLQYVSNQGKNAFVAPGPNDLRGPCPGLNAMANHNYIPHNGIATIAQFTQGTYDVFGMGQDLGGFLAAYGAIMDGDLTSWSIGGPPSGSTLLGPQGISGSHNKYESDVSPTRGDLYETGNNYKLNLTQFNQLYSLPLGPSGYDLSVLTPFRSTRFQSSLSSNPYFFNGPFSGIQVQPAAYTFIYRFMSNKSSAYPEGYLSGPVLKSFFSVTGEPGSFIYKEGYERIPDNWYKRAVGDEYTIPFFEADLLAAATQYPEFLSVGGNTGTRNSFVGVNVRDLTGGVYSSQTLLEGNNLACFSYQVQQQLAPDLLKGVLGALGVGKLASGLSQLNAAFSKVYSVLGGCPQLESIDTDLFKDYPGAKGTS